jgi:hypothetical protein
MVGAGGAATHLGRRHERRRTLDLRRRLLDDRLRGRRGRGVGGLTGMMMRVSTGFWTICTTFVARPLSSPDQRRAAAGLLRYRHSGAPGFAASRRIVSAAPTSGLLRLFLRHTPLRSLT